MNTTVLIPCCNTALLSWPLLLAPLRAVTLAAPSGTHAHVKLDSRLTSNQEGHLMQHAHYLHAAQSLSCKHQSGTNIVSTWSVQLGQIVGEAAQSASFPSSTSHKAQICNC